MSKQHLTSSAADLDAELDQYLKNKKVNPVVRSASDGIDLFNQPEEKKKSRLQQMVAYLIAKLYRLA